MDPLGEFIERRLDSMLSGRAAPGAWGGPEAFELQVLLLLEALHGFASTTPFMVRYCLFLRPRHSTLGSRPLSAVSGDFELLLRELQAFRADLRGSAHEAPT